MGEILNIHFTSVGSLHYSAPEKGILEKRYGLGIPKTLSKTGF